MVTRYKGMISKGIWISEELFDQAKKRNPLFNLSHYVSEKLQRDFGTVEQQVDLFLSERDKWRI